jgi:hypothetical protein
MTCKDCIHYDACKFYNKNLPEEYDTIEWQCDNFKDKSRIVELPYKVGDKVYYITIKRYVPLTHKIVEAEVLNYNINGYGICDVEIRPLDLIRSFTISADEVFSTKSEAEVKLKELNNETT